jgi:regulator of sigma E protease
MHVLKTILIILEVVLLFNLLIFVHELGHFLAGRWRGLKIERFAIWFGKPIWKKKVNGIEYALGWIPAGGYVSLPQMAPMEAIEGKSETPVDQLPPISAMDKIIVAFAGPLFSFLLAGVFACIIFGIGRPVSERETTTTVGYVEKGGPADQAGLKVGDVVLEVDNRPVTKFGGMGSSVQWRIVRSEGDKIPIKVRRTNEVTKTSEILTLESGFVKEKTRALARKALRQISIEPSYTPIISDVSSNSPAARAGLQEGDHILFVNGNKLYSPAGLGEYIEAHGQEKLTLQVLRPPPQKSGNVDTGSKQFEVSLTPEIPQTTNSELAKPRIGVAWDSVGKIALANPGVIEQLGSSVDAMISTFSALLSRKSDIKAQHLSGPYKITNIFFQLLQAEHGWRMALWFSVILNVNLALLNLLPIPVLDGGHITLAVIEAVRRKPVNLRLLSVVQTTCAVLIIGYMLYVSFYDVQDSSWRRQETKPPEMKFAPPQPAQQPSPAPSK